ncbi:MAG: TetR/AcrR family transcriptional regulator [Clostridiaceae bacterium]|nr:TetR/AcrR family transcriptional regulator [Clostridiaceae bacterium]MBW4861085.1 TetR/AcrR family transcriptional regulator [Clostridiaceae bacterium]MBW4867710.1 TetR/AcrR family transcriptional regulator [Clostridiaceae bacterium]
MPKKLFYQLDIDKRNRITDAGLIEFAQYSYNEASTNSIVKKASIGKGSLFKYFVNKEDLYFYILDYVIADLGKNLKEELPKLKGDIFEIILIYAEAEFNWYIENIDKYNLLKRAFSDDSSSIYKKTVERYKLTGDSFYYKILGYSETQALKWEKEKVLNVLKWVLEGFNAKFIKKADQYSNINDIKDCYLEELKKYIEILKEGLCE